MNIKNNCYKVLLLRYPTLIALEFSEVREMIKIYFTSLNYQNMSRKQQLHRFTYQMMCEVNSYHQGKWYK